MTCTGFSYEEWFIASRSLMDTWLSKTLCIHQFSKVDAYMVWELKIFIQLTIERLYGDNIIFKILREWDPLKNILFIWKPKSHDRLINTRLYHTCSFH